jgi:hypothetical protein
MRVCYSTRTQKAGPRINATPPILTASSQDSSRPGHHPLAAIVRLQCPPKRQQPPITGLLVYLETSRREGSEFETHDVLWWAAHSVSPPCPAP